MKTRKLFILAAILLQTVHLTAQKTNKDYWNLGIGFNFVDNDGSPTSHLFNAKEHWNGMVVPNHFTVGYSFQNNFDLDFNYSLNTFQVGKIVDNEYVRTSKFFMSTGITAKYHFNSKVIQYKSGKLHWFDPYVNLGTGVTVIKNKFYMIPTFGFGSNFWFSRNIGVNLQTIANAGLGNKAPNYLMHVITFKYRY